MMSSKPFFFAFFWVLLCVFCHTSIGFVHWFVRLYSEVMRALRHKHPLPYATHFTHISFVCFRFSSIKIFRLTWFCEIRLVNAGFEVVVGFFHYPGSAWFLYLILFFVEIFCRFAIFSCHLHQIWRPVVPFLLLLVLLSLALFYCAFTLY